MLISIVIKMFKVITTKGSYLMPKGDHNEK